ncbi:MAG: transposase [Phycisphaerales bacterium]|nr:MAG: transposase [Phycisphaerales bacterium]
MPSNDFILNKTRCLLHEFVGPIVEDADKPRKKFIRQAVGAILLAGSLIVTEFARWIRDDCSDRFYTVKRLLNHLVSARGDLTGVVQAYRTSVAKYVQHDTPIIIDLTDLAKPRARKMKYLAYVRDASEHKLVPGYWCVEVYAHLKGKRVLPLALEAFSVDDPAVGSQNLQIDRTVKAVDKAIDGKGVWVADRGFDGLNSYETWFSTNCNFVVRQRGDRHIVTSNGIHVVLSDLVEHIRQSNARRHLRTDIVWAKVTLPDHPKQLYVVASWLPGAEMPLILLTTMVVEDIEQAKQIVWYYRQRWACEEVGQFLKSRVGLERFRIRHYEAIQRLMVLAMLAMGFLTWILLRTRLLTKALFQFTSQFRKKTEFLYYRLLDGLQEFARLHRLRLGKTQLQPLRNG